jgi:non-ribosomal peptide synthetase component E (peptide arylation enzyme)
MAPRFPIDGVRYRGREEREVHLRSGDWLDATAGELLRRSAKEHPDKVVVVGHDGTLTLGELDRLTESAAAGLLGAGLRPSDRVIFQIGTVKEIFIALYACFKAGIVPVCTLPQYREIEIQKLAERSGATAYLVQADVHPSFDQLAFARRMRAAIPAIGHLIVTRGTAGPGELSLDALARRYSVEEARARVRPHDPDPDDVAAFQMSGGSTGLPKLIPRMHAEYLGSAAALGRRYELTAADVSLWTLPLIHNAGMLFMVLPVAISQRTVVALPRFEIREFLEAVARHRVTFSGSIGPVAPRMLEFDAIRSFDLSALRQFFTLSRADALERHVGVICGNMFGITEGLLLATAPSEPGEARHGSVGWPVAQGDEIRLLEIGGEREVSPGAVGELCFRGPSTLTGYFNDPSANTGSFTSDGFFRTGDLVRAVNHHGRTYYVFEGRIKDNINRGGEKIGAEEVESVVAAHPCVADVRVVAMPDPIYGEKVCAFIIVRPNRTLPTLGELVEFLISQGLAKYKIPERIEEITAFPTTSVGKVDKGRLRALVADLLAAENLSRATG